MSKSPHRLHGIYRQTFLGLCFSMALVLCLITACAPAMPELTPTKTAANTITPSATITITATQLPTPTATITWTPTPEPSFSFTVTSDISHYSTPEYLNYPNFFAALLGYVKDFGPGDFMVTTGDVLPAADARWTIDQVLGEDYLWFPLPGNHDFGKAVWENKLLHNSINNKGNIAVIFIDLIFLTQSHLKFKNTHFF